MLAAIILAGGVIIFAVVLSARYAEGRAWRSDLMAYRLVPPRNLTPDDVSAWLGAVAAATHAPRGALLPEPPVALEIRATQRGISHFLLVPTQMRGAMLSGLRAHLPGVRLEDAPDYLRNRPGLQMAVEVRLTSRHRPLALERAQATSTGILATLQPLAAREEVVLQWVLTGAGTPAPVRRSHGQGEDSSLPWWLEGDTPRDADDLRAARVKQRDQLLWAVLRIGVAGDDKARVLAVFGRVFGAFRNMNAAGAQLVRRWWLWPAWASRRLARLSVPVLHWPALANSRELAGSVGLIGGAALPGLPASAARQLPPPVSMPSRGISLGHSNYVGMQHRPLALKTDDRLRHTWILGPTGTGKSTLLANLILQDIKAGRGVGVIDPKGDLIGEVLERIPEKRYTDVLVIDPSQTDRPVGINVLDIGHGEHARELAVDHLVGLMASLWRSSFGPRTADVLRQALLTLTHTAAADGSRHTLLELPELLLNPQFRAMVLRQATVPESVRPFWTAYEQLTDTDRARTIGPSLNKLRSFTTRTSLRLLLGQSHGIRLSEVFTDRRVLLVALSKGLLGTDTTALAGSLIMAGLWQATLERVTLPANRRHPVMLYLDEFQDFLRLPVDLPDMLAQSRGLGVGNTLAHQYLAQLSDEVRTAVLGTARTQVVFQIEHQDAAALAKRFAPLTADDLSALAAWEIAVRPCVDAATRSPVTGRTLPLPPPVTDGQALAAASRARFGTPRSEVEAAIRARVTPPTRGGNQLGRQRREAPS
jgi:hypothetical protein